MVASKNKAEAIAWRPEDPKELPCHGKGDIFVPDVMADRQKSATIYAEKVEAARALCRTCAYQEPCLAEALSRKEQGGIYAGTTRPQRIALRRALQAEESSRNGLASAQPVE